MTVLNHPVKTLFANTNSKIATITAPNTITVVVRVLIRRAWLFRATRRT
jgi:hypothetical protein